MAVLVLVWGAAIFVPQLGSGLLHSSLVAQRSIMPTETNPAQKKSDSGINNSSKWHTVETWSLGVYAFAFSLNILKSPRDYHEKLQDLNDGFPIDDVRRMKEKAVRRFRRIHKLLNKICKVLLYG